MKPALFLHPYIASYPVLMLLGFVCGWWLARKRAPLYGIESCHVDNISLLLPAVGLFGARFFARLFYAKVSLVEAFKFWEGDGLVFYGGFGFGVIAVLAYGAVRRISILKLCDCLAPAVAVGLAFGRIGCFLGGCCWGDLCIDPSRIAQLPAATAQQVRTIPQISNASWPLAVRFPPESEPFKQQVKLGLISAAAEGSLPVHPVQLYESALAAGLALFVARRYKGGHAEGSASMAVLIGYALIRFGAEYLRADNKAYAFGLTLSQIISMEILLFCAIGFGVQRFFIRSGRPDGARSIGQSAVQSV